MVQQLVVETVLQSQKKQSTSFDWHRFVCSNLMEGLKAYGFAVIGMPPSARGQA